MKNLLTVIAILLSTAAFAQNWQRISPLPQGNTLNDVAFEDAQNAWAVGDGGAVLHSTDAGETWIVAFAPAAIRINLFRIEFPDSIHGWIMGYSDQGDSTQITILNTTDRGQTWSEQLQLYSNPWSDISFPDARHGFIVSRQYSTDEPIFLRTTDGGDTWMPMRADTSVLLAGYVEFVDSLTGWAPGHRDVLLTTRDGGTTWTWQRFPDSTGDVQGVDFTDPNHGWVSLGNYYLSRTTDGGATWEQIEPPVQALNICFADSLTGWTLTWDEIQHTTDGGSTWATNPIPSHNDLTRLRHNGPRSVWAIGTAGTVLQSTDGGTQWQRKAGAEDITYSNVTFADSNKGWMLGDGAVYHTTDGGMTWTVQFASDTLDLYSLSFADSLHGWACDGNGTVVRSANGGETWTVTTIGRGEYTSAIIFFLDSEHGWLSQRIHSEHPPSNFDQILYSTDGGSSWSACDLIGDAPQLTQFFFSNRNTGWARAAFLWTLHSRDGGVSWQYILFPQIDGSPAAVWDLSAMDSLYCWAATDSGLYRTTDGAATWQNVYPHTHAVFGVHFADRLNGWMLADGSIYNSTDGGLSWTPDSIHCGGVEITSTDPNHARGRWRSRHHPSLYNRPSLGNGSVLHSAAFILQPCFVSESLQSHNPLEL